MTEINTVGLSKDINAIMDILEEVEHDIKGMSGWLNYHANTQGIGKELKAFADEISWLATDVVEIYRNGAPYMKTYQAMGAYDFFIERLYDIKDRTQADYWRDEINDNILKIARLYAPMLTVMENAVIKHAKRE